MNIRKMCNIQFKNVIDKNTNIYLNLKYMIAADRKWTACIVVLL